MASPNTLARNKKFEGLGPKLVLVKEGNPKGGWKPSPKQFERLQRNHRNDKIKKLREDLQKSHNEKQAKAAPEKWLLKKNDAGQVKRIFKK